jgi:hypothetical protein
MAKPVLGVSTRKESRSRGGSPWHVSAAVPSGPVVVDVLSELEQAVTAHRAKTQGRECVEK